MPRITKAAIREMGRRTDEDDESIRHGVGPAGYLILSFSFADASA